MNCDVDPSLVLADARRLLERSDPATAGLWPRASALLARQALELALRRVWQHHAPGIADCSARAQLLCLPAYLGQEDGLAQRVSYAWAGLSRACHVHAYELPPTASELTGWISIVEEFLEALANGSRGMQGDR
jgi:hypothetical protein